MARPKRVESSPPRLAQCRHLAGLTQEQVAEWIGITVEMVRRHEHGTSTPSTVNRERYCELYQSDEDTLGLCAGDRTMIRSARERAGLTQLEVVSRMREVAPGPLPDDVLRQYVRWEQGKSRPSPFYAALLQKVMDVSAGDTVDTLAAAPQDEGCTSTGTPGPVAASGAAVESDLRRARDAHGWTSARLNYELHRLARDRGVEIASEASLRVMISQWENGVQLPDIRYRDLLNTVLGIPIYTDDTAAPMAESSDVTTALLSPPGRTALAAGDTGTIIRLARQAHSWNQHELSRRSGYSQARISRLERGVGRAARDVTVLADLATTLGVRPGLLGVRNPADTAGSFPSGSSGAGTTVMPDPASDLVDALLSVLHSGASLVIGIAPTPALTALVQRQAGLDTAAGIAAMGAAPDIALAAG